MKVEPHETCFSVRPLADVVEFLDSQRRPITAHQRRPGPVPYYGANGIQDYVDGFIFDEPLVLLAEDGGHFDEPHRGIAYGVAGRSWVNNHAHVLRPTSEVDSRYLVRVLENYDARPFLTGSTRAKLTKSGASRMPVPVPPIDEQRRIAVVLDRADEMRAARLTSIHLLDSLNAATFHEMFGTYSSLQQRWVHQPLAECAAAINDCPHSTPAWTEHGFVCLRTSNLGVGSWSWTDTRYVSDETFRLRSKRGELAAGDIVLSREGTVGVAAIIPPDVPMCMGQRLVQVRPMPKKVLAEFLLQYLLMALAPARISHTMVGSTAQHLNVRELKSLPVPVPPMELQTAFTEVTARRDAVRRSQDRSRAEFNLLFAALRHRAFAGHL